jgi:hypothetical protein
MITTSTSRDYWLKRLVQAIDSARCAPSDRSRMAYLELAQHYRAMHELINGQEFDASAGAVLALDLALAVEPDNYTDRAMRTQAA